MPILKAYCHVCNLWLNSSDQLSAHQTGRAHKRREMIALGFSFSEGTNVAVQFTDQTRSLALMAASQENSNVTSQSNIQNGTTQRDNNNTDNNNTGQNNTCRTKSQKGEEYFCDVCVVQLTSKSQADMHYEGSKHKKALTVMAGKREENQYEGIKRMAEDVCDICNVTLSSKAVADAHYAGSKHVKKLKLSQSLRANCAIGFSRDTTHTIAAITALPAISSNLSQIVPSLSVSVVPVSPGTVGLQQKGSFGNFLYCSFCGVGVNSRHQMDAHWHGTRHKNNVNGLLPQAKFSVRTAPIPGRHMNTGHIFSNYGPSIGQSAYRTGQSMSYMPQQV